MPSSLTSQLVPATLARRGTRSSRMAQELSYAMARTEPKLLAQWGLVTGKHFAGALTRRGKNVVQLAGSVVSGVGRESRRAYAAYQQGKLSSHTQARMSAAYDSVSETSRNVSGFVSRLATAVKYNPKEAAPNLLMVVVSSVLVSGGPDGDGGAPDLDLMFGIDAHRSILSHSILMGSALEAGIMSLVELVRLLHEKLPAQHDAIWDVIYQKTGEFAHSAQVGASIGMAYHLFVDALAQPAPYKDLPISMPMEAHQSLFAANAAAELLDAGKKPERTSSRKMTKAQELTQRRREIIAGAAAKPAVPVAPVVKDYVAKARELTQRRQMLLSGASSKQDKPPPSAKTPTPKPKAT